jgi:hypothetical protein
MTLPRVFSTLLTIALLMLRPGIGMGQVQGELRLSAGSEQLAPQTQSVTAAFLSEPGVHVEILGLNHWTPSMLRDSLAVHAPGVSIASSRLATALREQLGFRDAIVRRQPGDSAINVLAIVVEPQDSMRILRRVLSQDTTQSKAPWSSLVEVVRTQLRLLTDVLEAPIQGRAMGLPPTVPIEVRPDSATVRQIWAVLETHDTEEDAVAARTLLSTSPNVYDRLAAVTILSNFERDDTTWHALTGAILDRDPRVRGLALHVLHALRSHAVRHVDWRPAASDLHAILNGAVLASLPAVLDLLVATDVAPDLAGSLLNDGGHGVLILAGASSPSVRRPSYRFLRAVSGGLEYESPAEWRAWIGDLTP